MKISVICPTYNSQEYIREAIESVFNQSVSPHELIISDDGSSDSTLSIARKICSQARHVQCKILEAQKHKGAGAARNRGLRAVTGDWIGFLDADDVWYRHKLEKVQTVLGQNPNANFLYHNEHLFVESRSAHCLDYSRFSIDSTDFVSSLFMCNFISTSTVVCSRDIIAKDGFFNEKLVTAQDYELWLRLSPRMRPVFIREPLGMYRKHSNSNTKKFARSHLKNVLRALYLNRERVSARIFFYACIRHTIAYCFSHFASAISVRRR